MKKFVKIPRFVLIDEDNNLRVKKKISNRLGATGLDQVQIAAISNRLGATGLFFTVPNKYAFTVCSKVYKKQKHLDKHCIVCKKEKG